MVYTAAFTKISRKTKVTKNYSIRIHQKYLDPIEHDYPEHPLCKDKAYAAISTTVYRPCNTLAHDLMHRYGHDHITLLIAEKRRVENKLDNGRQVNECHFWKECLEIECLEIVCTTVMQSQKCAAKRWQQTPAMQQNQEKTSDQMNE
jgi:hypothetical protein